MEFWGARKAPPVLFLPVKFLFSHTEWFQNPPPPQKVGFVSKPAPLFLERTEPPPSTLTPFLPPLSCFPSPYVVLAHGMGHDSGSPGKNRKEGWGKKAGGDPVPGLMPTSYALTPPSSTASPAAGSCFGSRQHCPPRASFQHPIPLSCKDFFPFLKGFFSTSVPPSQITTAGCSQQVSPAALPILPFQNLSCFLGSRILEVLEYLKKHHPDEGVQRGKMQSLEQAQTHH